MIKNKKIVIGLLIIIVAVVSVALIRLNSSISKNTVQQKPIGVTQTSEEGGPKFSGPTEEEKLQADRHKDALIEEKKSDFQAVDGKRQVKPRFSSLNTNQNGVYIGAFISGVYENAGTCRYVLTLGTYEISKTVNASANATTTDCSGVQIARSEFTVTGEWTTRVEYESSASKGVSELMKVKID